MARLVRHSGIPGPHRQDAALYTWSAIVANCAIWAKEISVAPFSWMPALDPVHSAACDHIAVPFQHQVNFFFAGMMMRKIRSSRRDFHQEKTCYCSSGSDPVPFAIHITQQQPVQGR